MRHAPVQFSVRSDHGPHWTIRVPRSAAYRTITALSEGTVGGIRKRDHYLCQVEDVPEVDLPAAGPDDGAGGWPFVRGLAIGVVIEIAGLWLFWQLLQWLEIVRNAPTY